MPLLLENEKLIEKFHPSRWHFWRIYFSAVFSVALAFGLLFFSVVFADSGNFLIKGFGDVRIPTLVFVFLFALGPLLFGFAELIRVAHAFYITDKRVIEGFSFFTRRFASTQYSRIQNIEARQNLIERIVGIGDLEIYTAGYAAVNRPEIAFRGIKNPFRVKKIIIELKLKETSGPVLTAS